MRWLLMFFILVPLAEMLLLFEVSDHIGGLWTVGLVVLTAVIGVQILKRQGIATLLRANQRLDRGQLPGQEMFEGFFLAFAGALLLTPGFITDTLGFICLTPPLRRAMVRRLLDSGVLTTGQSGPGRGFYWSSQGRSQQRDQSTVIEGEFIEETDVTGRREDADPWQD
jgi:UPF0716 protein FxsA